MTHHGQRCRATRPTLAFGLIALWLLAATGCGFHLRGGYQLPAVMNATMIAFQSAVDFEFRDALENALRSSNATVVEHKDEASAVLSISKQKLEKRTLSINAQGQVQQYQLRYSVVYSLAEAGGKTLVSAKEVNFVREFTFDGSDILGNRGEESHLQRDMQRDAAQQIVRSLQAINL